MTRIDGINDSINYCPVQKPAGDKVFLWDVAPKDASAPSEKITLSSQATQESISSQKIISYGKDVVAYSAIGVGVILSLCGFAPLGITLLLSGLALSQTKCGGGAPDVEIPDSGGITLPAESELSELTVETIAESEENTDPGYVIKLTSPEDHYPRNEKDPVLSFENPAPRSFIRIALDPTRKGLPCEAGADGQPVYLTKYIISDPDAHKEEPVELEEPLAAHCGADANDSKFLYLPVPADYVKPTLSFFQIKTDAEDYTLVFEVNIESK